MNPLAPGNDNERRHELLDTLVNAVHTDDPAFAVEVVMEQQLIDPVFIAEFMDVKRRKSEDPVMQTRWAGTLATYLAGIQTETLPAEQQDSLRQIQVDLEFDSIVSNEEMAASPTIIHEKQDQSGTVDWKTFEFDTTMNFDDYTQLRIIPAFVEAEDYASGKKPSPYSNRSDIELALTIVNSKIPTELTAKALSILDVYVYRRAEAYATDRLPSPYSNRNGAEMAAIVIKSHGSTPERQDLMRQSLDKHIFKRADDYASGRSPSPYTNRNGLEMADHTIKQHASSDYVAAYMKRELDSHVLRKSVTYITGESPSPHTDLKMAVDTIQKHASDPEIELLMRQTIDSHILALAQRYLNGGCPSPYTNVSGAQMAMRTIKYASTPEMQRTMQNVLFQ